MAEHEEDTASSNLIETDSKSFNNVSCCSHNRRSSIESPQIKDSTKLKEQIEANESKKLETEIHSNSFRSRRRAVSLSEKSKNARNFNFLTEVSTPKSLKSSIKDQLSLSLSNEKDRKDKEKLLRISLKENLNSAGSLGDHKEEEETKLIMTIPDAEEQKAAFYIGDESLCQSTELIPKPLRRKESRKLQLFAVADKNGNIKTKVSESPPVFTPPDGGYGWVVALAACLSNSLVFGFLKSYGILYVSIMDRYPESSAYEASWLPVFLSTLGLVVAPIAGICCRKYTCKKSSFVGGILIAGGVFAGAFAPSMLGLTLAVGILSGLGIGFTSTAGVLITSLYFEERRSLASGICISGNALGSFVFPPLIEYLLENYKLKGTLLILSAVQLNICAISLLYRPVANHALIQQKARLREEAKLPHLTIKNDILKETPKISSSPSNSSFHNVIPQMIYDKSQSLLKNVLSKTTIHDSCKENLQEQELHRQVSILRSVSVLSSVPDITAYCKSFSSVQDNQDSSLLRCPSSKISLNRTRPFPTPSFASMADAQAQEYLVTKPMCPSTIRNKRLNLDFAGTDLRRVHSTIESRNFPRRLSRTRKSCSPPTSPLSVDINVMAGMSFNSKDLPVEPLLEEVASDAESITDIKISISNDANESFQKTTEVKEPKNSCGCGVCSSFSTLFDCSILKEPVFILTSVSIVFMAAGCPHTLFLIPAYMKSLDHEVSRITMLLSISSAVDLVGRLGIGFIADLNLLPICILYTVCCSFAGIGILLLPFVTSYEGICLLATLFTFGMGSWVVLIPTILAKHHGAQRLASSYGIARMFNGFTNFISPQISGLLIDYTGRYEGPFWFMGSSVVLGAFVMLIEPLLSRTSPSASRSKETDKDIEKELPK